VRIPFFSIVCRGNFDILCKNLDIHELGDLGVENAFKKMIIRRALIGIEVSRLVIPAISEIDTTPENL